MAHDPGWVEQPDDVVGSTKPQRPFPWTRITLGAMIVLGGLIAVGPPGVAKSILDAPANQTDTPTTHTIPDFADLVARVKPAVVSITSRLEISPEQSRNAQRSQVLPFPFNQMIPQLRAVELRGSGFFIKPDGTIVTNSHVVEDAVSVMVTLDDGLELAARVLGRDARTDIAVLKVAATKPLPYLQLGDSAGVRAGEWVVVIGNPFGLGGTATVGIVSAYNRNIGGGPYDQFIQVDAPINEGNSGGPLFTQDGKVIGMAAAILSPSGGSVGIGFAIPASVIQTIVPQLEAAGHIVWGHLGIESQQITPALAKALRLPDRAGALVADVEPDSPASRAGLTAGDVVRAVDGHAVANPRELAVAIANMNPGDQTQLDIIHDCQAQHVTVTVAALPEAHVEQPAVPKNSPLSQSPPRRSAGGWGLHHCPKVCAGNSRCRLTQPASLC